MGKTLDTIDDALQAWIEAQRMFFVGTAPSGADGHVNLSPKGPMETFRVLGLDRVAYLDLVGSGVETIAHLRDNGRITVMLCAFEGAPRIVRLYGRGRSLSSDSPAFAALIEHFPSSPELRLTARSIVDIDVSRVADSCGYTVPRMQYAGDRDQLFRWAENRSRTTGDDWKAAYVRDKNAASIDGLPGLTPPVGAARG